MATQDEINALSRKKDGELQSASMLDDKIKQLETDSQSQIGKFEQKARDYQNSSAEGDDQKAAEMQQQIEQNRSYMTQEIDGLRAQANEHRANARRIQDEMEQKQTELKEEAEQKAREEAEKNAKEREAAKHITESLF